MSLIYVYIAVLSIIIFGETLRLRKRLVTLLFILSLLFGASCVATFILSKCFGFSFTLGKVFGIYHIFTLRQIGLVHEYDVTEEDKA